MPVDKKRCMNHILIKDIEISFDEYFAKEKISKTTQDKLRNIDILAVPTQYHDSNYYFAKETISFLKYCNGKGSKYTVDYLADGDIKVLSLHCADLWLPTIICKDVLLPIIIGLITNYISDYIKGRINSRNESNVDVKIIVKNNNKGKEFYYNGPASKFVETFKATKFKKL